MEIKHGSARVLAFTEDNQEDLHNDDLLLLDGLRRRAGLRVAKYQQDLRRYHSRYIRPHSRDRRSCPQENPLQGRPPQALAYVGRTIQGGTHRQARRSTPRDRRRHTRQEPVEYRASTQVLSVIIVTPGNFLSLEGSTPLLL